MSNHHPNGNKRSREWSPVDLSSKKRTRMYLDSHKDVEKRRRDRINSYLETIRELLPIYNHLPKQKRIDKADVLDMTVVYLKTVNSFLQNLGVKDVFCAIHQHLTLLNSSEKWIHSNADTYDSVPSFVRGLSKHLQSEHRQTAKLLAETVAVTGEPQSDTGELFSWPYFLHSPSKENSVRGCCSKDDDKMWKALQSSLEQRQNLGEEVDVHVGFREEVPSNSNQTPFEQRDVCSSSESTMVNYTTDAENNNYVVKQQTDVLPQQFEKPIKKREVLYCLPQENPVVRNGSSVQCVKVSQPSTSHGDLPSASKKCHCDLKILMRDQGVNTEEKKEEGSLKKELTLTVNAGKVELDIASLLSQAQGGNCVVPVTFQGQVCLGLGDPGRGSAIGGESSS